MHSLIWSLVAVAPLYLPPAETLPPAEPPVYATIETTLATQAKQIRMYAFDGDAGTYFASAKNPTAADHFTVVFEKPVTMKWIVAQTGKPDGSDKLEAGVLEMSEDGKTFQEVAKFTEGVAKARPVGKRAVAVRIRPTENMSHPLAICEITLDASPAVATYKYPVEYTLDVADAPELKDWGLRVVQICERAYQWIGDDLRSPGYKPPTTVVLAMKSSYNGVAAAGGGKITGSVKYFKGKPNDVGAMVHETVHIIQRYQGGKNPGWLVEGIADYIRFFKYEPDNIGKLNVAKAKYDASYRVSARFLAYVTDKYNTDLVLDLNRAMREKKYSETLWKDLTGKTVQELGAEWLGSLKAGQNQEDKKGGLAGWALDGAFLPGNKMLCARLLDYRGLPEGTAQRDFMLPRRP